MSIFSTARYDDAHIIDGGQTYVESPNMFSVEIFY